MLNTPRLHSHKGAQTEFCQPFDYLLHRPSCAQARRSDAAFKGAHLLRHSLATDLLRRGASLVEIGQLLRHSQPNTTQIYAKVDIAALRAIALPWPGVA
ncbi:MULTISPECIES: tyrosine-type recombinase/integrase [unclassified Mesorhizobium]|uniref:tyrosine-type recombinase/integrase n=1 Tax=unclassified Mesorhizobium TaxID=325217 RepID=UPI001AEE0D98|nr:MULTISPECIES: tyrosine-type recombinase/integrase [unclassified Mesorhizobium]